MPRVPVFEAGSDGWSDWVNPHGVEFRFVCCDCGLAHDLEFSEPVLFRAKRNERSTSQIRRYLPPPTVLGEG